MTDNNYIIRTQVVDGVPRYAIILPVAIHDVLYTINEDKIIPQTVTGIDVLIRLNHVPEHLRNLGERFFLTYQEAEAYLKSQNREKDNV